MVEIVLIAAGNVADYIQGTIAKMQAALAAKLSVPLDAVQITIVPASVRITALITFPSSIPEQDISGAARSLLKDPATASSELGVTIESVEYIGQYNAPRPPPSPNSPPVYPGGLEPEKSPPSTDVALILGLAIPLPLIVVLVCCITLVCFRQSRVAHRKRQLMQSDEETGTALMTPNTRSSRHRRSQVAVAPGPPPPDTSFAAADADGSGALSAAEFANAYNKSSQAPAPARPPTGPALVPLAPLSSNMGPSQPLPQFQQLPLQPIQQRAPAPGALPPVAPPGAVKPQGQPSLPPVAPPASAGGPMPIAPPSGQLAPLQPGRGSGRFAIANDALPSLTQTREQARVD